MHEHYTRKIADIANIILAYFQMNPHQIIMI